MRVNQVELSRGKRKDNVTAIAVNPHSSGNRGDPCSGGEERSIAIPDPFRFGGVAA